MCAPAVVAERLARVYAEARRHAEARVYAETHGGPQGSTPISGMGP